VSEKIYTSELHFQDHCATSIRVVIKEPDPNPNGSVNMTGDQFTIEIVDLGGTNMRVALGEPEPKHGDYVQPGIIRLRFVGGSEQQFLIEALRFAADCIERHKEI
jgi:hypothetical protein